MLDPSWLCNPEQAGALQTAILSGLYNDDDLCRVFAYADTVSLTPESFHALVMATRQQTIALHVTTNLLLDVCGTGGDNCNTVNVSTAIAPILASMGVPVAKHGNRAASSRCGSSDVLAALGLDLDAPATDLLDQLAQTNLVFLFAPQFNPVLKRVASARKKYGKKTYFNLMGPLLNPMPLTHQMIGITDPDDAVLMGYSAKALGRTGVMFVTGDYGEDEVSAAGATLVQVVTDSGALARQSYHPSDFGFPVYTLDAIRGGDARFNAKILRTIWENTAPESYRVVSVLNAALAYHLVTQQPILACRDRVVTELESGNIMRVLKKRLTQA